MELMNQLEADFNNDPHLLGYIEDFLRKREPIETWQFRKMDDGSVYWINHEQHKAVKSYPHIIEMRNHIAMMKDKVDQLKANPEIIKDKELLQALFPHQSLETTSKALCQEATKIVDGFMTILRIMETKKKTAFEMRKDELMSMVLATVTTI
jgi:hypothetical protein